MKPEFVRIILTLAILCVSVPSWASTQQNEDAKRPCAVPVPSTGLVWLNRFYDDELNSCRGAKDTTGPHMSNALAKAMKALFGAAGQKDWIAAKSNLDEARAIPDPSDFDRYEIEVAASYVAIGLSDQLAALTSYRKIFASPFFSSVQKPDEQSAMLKNAMVLSNAAGDYAGAVTMGTRLATMGPLDETSAIELAIAYFGDKDFVRAQNLAQKIIDAAVAAGLKPNSTAEKIVEQCKTAVK